MKNWANLRAAQNEAMKECPARSMVPFTGIILSDLVFNAETPSLILPFRHLINLRKFRLKAKCFRDLVTMQKYPTYEDNSTEKGKISCYLLLLY